MKLTENTLNLYAIKAYTNPHCYSEKEYEEDFRRLGTIKKTVTKYLNGKNTNLKQMVNCFISFFNVFEHRAAANMLFYKLREDQYSCAKTVLYFLNCLPFTIETADLSNVPIDKQFYMRLLHEYEITE